MWYTFCVAKRSCTVVSRFRSTKVESEVMHMSIYDLLSVISCVYSFISLLIAVYELGRHK